MIELFDFQHRAVDAISKRFVEYMGNRPWRGRGDVRIYVPFYQALGSITASGKTVIMAETVAQLLPEFPVKPVILWLSKGRVVVAQTYTNLQDGGKYRHLLKDYDVRLLAEYEPDDVQDDSKAIVYFATVGTFNQKDKEKGKLRLYQSEIDFADRSIWDALIQRTTRGGERRPLLVVYDEAQNLTDQQTALLTELEPDGFILASATLKLPQAILKICESLKEDLGWADDKLVTMVSPRDVADSGLVKKQIVLGGYQAYMEPIMDDLLADMETAAADAEALGVPFRPKAIYVCKTNIIEGNAFKKDDPKRPFTQRQAPPILIWRYLVEEKGVDPATVAVYANLEVDKDYRLPGEFVLFKGGDKDYDDFTRGNFRHIIFNLGLQEGWDDPECYFAYIDKSMQSNVQVKQVIGRVLRQPDAQHYESEALNTARFYVRVDKKGVFAEIVDEVREQLASENPEIEFTSYDTDKKRPIAYLPKKRLTVPHVYRDPSAAHERIDRIIEKLIDFREGGENVQGRGAKALVQQRIGEADDAELIWVERENHNKVSARWIFQRAVRREFSLALEVTRSDDVKLDAMVELGSRAEEHLLDAAGKVVEAYLTFVVLKQRQHNPYIVGEVMVDPAREAKFKHALHDGYSGLNKLELPFAQELDRTRLAWARNPSRSGYALPLLARGKSQNFYPDFLVWKGKDVFALDTTGEHILVEKLGTKLLDITPHPKAKERLHVRLISEGTWDDKPQPVSKVGYTVWALSQGNKLRPMHCETIAETVKLSLTAEL